MCSLRHLAEGQDSRLEVAASSTGSKCVSYLYHMYGHSVGRINLTVHPIWPHHALQPDLGQTGAPWGKQIDPGAGHIQRNQTPKCKCTMKSWFVPSVSLVLLNRTIHLNCGCLGLSLYVIDMFKINMLINSLIKNVILSALSM